MLVKVISHRSPSSSRLLLARCLTASFASEVKKNVSFSETVIRPFLKDTIKAVGETWMSGKRTLLETIVGGPLPVPVPTPPAAHITPAPGMTGYQNEVTVVSAPEVTIHPILGELLHDLQYKKIYVTDITSLVNATVWEKQRTLRHARAELIANTKIKNNSLTSLPGTITLYRHTPTGNIGIFDGQHRVAALFLLSQKGLWSTDRRNILVEVFDVADDVGEVMKLFKEINSAEPVNMMDMLDDDDEGEEELEEGVQVAEVVDVQKERVVTVNVAVETETVTDASSAGSEISTIGAAATSEEPKSLTNKQVKEIIDKACAQLHRQYADTMFKPSKQCRPPHVNIDKLREDLFDSDVCRDPALGIRTADQLLAHVHRLNDQMGSMSDEQWMKVSGFGGSKATKMTALAKARQYGLYIGMDKLWLVSR